jgi:CspA family cold shock protein
MTLNGRIKRLVTEKGFGFIAAGDTAEYFFHRSVVQGASFEDLRVGQAVLFNEGTSAPGKGPRAGRVFVDMAGQPDAA